LLEQLTPQELLTLLRAFRAIYGRLPIRSGRWAAILQDMALSSKSPLPPGAGFDRSTFLFVSTVSPLQAAQMVWLAPQPVELCVVEPGDAARDAATFACAGLAVPIVEEPLLAPRRFDESNSDLLLRHAEALRALSALPTRSTLVVWDDLVHGGSASPVLLDEPSLLQAAEMIERGLVGL
jgi:hypothetical protein